MHAISIQIKAALAFCILRKTRGSRTRRILLPFDYQWLHHSAPFCRVSKFSAHTGFDSGVKHTLKSMAKRGKNEHIRRLITFDTYPFRLPRHHSRGSRTWGRCRLNRCRVLPESREATTKLLPEAKVKKQYVVSFRLAKYYILFLLVLIM